MKIIWINQGYKMKIVVFTIYDSLVNIGSFLQADALRQVLEQMGHTVYFAERMPEKEILQHYRKILKQQNNGCIQKRFYILQKLKRNIVISKKTHTIERLYEMFRQDWNVLNRIPYHQVRSEDFDLAICGSDEIWNLRNLDIEVDFYTIGWLKNIHKLAYAICSGETSYHEWIKDKSCLNAILQFDMLLARDNITKKLLDKTMGKQTQLVCDPTILLGKNQYKLKNYHEKYGQYMLVYSYVYTKQEKKILRKYAKKNHLKIISPCLQADFADMQLNIRAYEFPSLVADAECVFSSTFHGTIFALMFAKRFCCIPKTQKVWDLLYQCSMESCAVTEEQDKNAIENLLNQPLPRAKIDVTLHNMRKKSYQILFDALTELANRTQDNSTNELSENVF